MFFGIVRWIPAQLVNPAVNSHTLMSLMVLKNVFPAQPVIQPVSVSYLHLFIKQLWLARITCFILQCQSLEKQLFLFEGLRTQKACTPLSDTVCEPVEGFFCVTQEKGSCRSAVKHSQCKPGEFIQHRGIDVHIFSVDFTKASVHIFGKYTSHYCISGQGDENTNYSSWTNDCA